MGGTVYIHLDADPTVEECVDFFAPLRLIGRKWLRSSCQCTPLVRASLPALLTMLAAFHLDVLVSWSVRAVQIAK